MSDIMMFPETVDEFMEQYKIVDSDEVYTNGAELVPVFRMKQWFEHVDAEPVRHAHWVYYKNMGYFCSACIESGLSPTNSDDNCGYSLDGTMNYCWNCGTKMDEVAE